MKDIRIFFKNGNRVSILVTKPKPNGLGIWKTKTHIFTEIGSIEKKHILEIEEIEETQEVPRKMDGQ